MHAQGSSAGPGEIAGEVARFGRLAARWWDPDGPMRPLHSMNGLRVRWVDTRLRAAFGHPARLLDYGCGAGLAAEALAAAGHSVLGADPSAEALAAARAHAAGRGLDLTYLQAGLPALAARGEAFPAIVALEVIEHVPDPAAFLAGLAGLLAPGGLLFVSTLNRTLKSLAVAKIGAEYVLRLLPRGTHDWRRFVTPAELAAHGRRAGLVLADLSGMAPAAPAPGAPWRESRDLGVNYIAMFASPPEPPPCAPG